MSYCDFIDVVNVNICHMLRPLWDVIFTKFEVGKPICS